MTPRKILICGLDGAGKTTLAKALALLIGAVHYDGDEIREITNNKDFSLAGRRQQVVNIRRLCDKVKNTGNSVIASFICPTASFREIFDADYTIWVNCEKRAKHPDTVALFESPMHADYVTDDGSSAERWAWAIADDMKTPTWDGSKPTALIIGRFQPFHDGHKALVKEAFKRAKQVQILIRKMPCTPDNPYSCVVVAEKIRAALSEYAGRLEIGIVPNISHFIYGRDVGYKVENIHLPPEIEKISATAIRKGASK